MARRWGAAADFSFPWMSTSIKKTGVQRTPVEPKEEDESLGPINDPETLDLCSANPMPGLLLRKIIEIKRAVI